MKDKTYEELGKHFMAIGLVFLTVGLITPLFQNGLGLHNLVSIILWLIFLLIGIYLLERSKDG